MVGPRLSTGFALLLAALTALASTAPAQASTITEKRVRDAVTWLAADERAGRNTGSKELAEAGEWLVDRLSKAGLKQLREGSWYHEFTLPAQRIDSDEIAVTITCRVDGKKTEVKLEPGHDVRQWTPSDGLKGDEPCTVAKVDDPVLQRMLQARSARRPVIIEVDQKHPYWGGAEGKHSVLVRRRKAARPIFLVRPGLLPKTPADRDVEWTAAWSVAAPERVEMPQRNVVGLLPAREGSDHKDEYIVVSAHYDHIGVGRVVDGDAINNGADDNATGTTAVLLLAEAMAKMPAPRRNILFVCFAAEEKGLLGSKAFCEQPPLPLDSIVANLNIEMIGRPAPGNVGKAWVTGGGFSDFESICGAALEKTGVRLVEFNMANQLFAQSDNYPFAAKGIVAHSISAGSLHEDYHRPSDEVDKLDLAHMTKIIRGLLDATLALAERDDPPAWNERGEEVLKRMRSRRRGR